MPDITTVLKYPVAYRLLNPENSNVVPRRIDDGMYYLCAPKTIYIQGGQFRNIQMGIAISFPEQIVVPIGDTGIKIIQNLHCRIDSDYNLLTGRGIQILAPTVLSPTYDLVELKLYLTSIKPGNHTIRAGEPLGTLQFTTTSPVVLGINQELPITGESSCVTSRSTKLQLK